MKLNSFVVMQLAVLAAIAAASTEHAAAAVVIDTGAPLSWSMPNTFDSNNYYAQEVSFGSGLSLTSVQTWIAGTIGDTFTISLFADPTAAGLSVLNNINSTALYSASATITASQGLSGVSNLAWGLSAGNYWVLLSAGAGDFANGISGSLASSFSTPPAALVTAAFSSDGGLTYSSTGVPNFGLQIAAAAAVPEPGSWALLTGGLLLIAGCARRRKPV